LNTNTIIPVNGINTDLSPFYLGDDKARLLKNIDLSLMQKDDGGNYYVFKPLSGTEIYDYDLVLPEGKNVCIGGGVSQDKKELYIFNWNENGNHHIYQIKEGKARIVFQDSSLKFRLEPEYYISSTGRLVVKKVCVGDEYRTYLYWVNGLDRHYFLCVEDSIDTNSFNHPFFSGADREELISLGVPTPLNCISVKPIKTGRGGINFIKEAVHRFRISFIDRYGRKSEHGIISEPYYTKDCYGNIYDCLELEFEIGGPFVEFIQIEKEYGNEWMIIDILHKYKSCDRVWYEREINPDLNYNSNTKTAKYIYCGGKSCIPIPDNETARNENPLPITSQSIFPLGGCIALANNTYGFEPLDCNVKDKIKFEVIAPDPDPVQEIQTRNIVVWMKIYNPFEYRRQALWKKGERIVFGGLGAGGQDEPAVATDYKQIFDDPNQEGFIGYLAGTEMITYSEQYILNRETNVYEKYGIAKNADEARNNTFIQRFEFKNVRPGKYIFRVAGHLSRANEPNFRSTSTYIAGHGRDFQNFVINEQREILIDVCNNDYDSIKNDNIVLVLYDLTVPRTNISFENRSRVVEGYVYETKDAEIGSIPIEGAVVQVNSSNAVRRVFTTDHNGFYFVAARDRRFSISISVLNNCQWQLLGTYQSGPNIGVKYSNFYATDRWHDYINKLCNRVKIKGIIKDCDNNYGIPNVTVILSNGGYVQSNENGEFELLAHDFMNPFERKLIFISNVKCAATSCSGERCLPVVSYFQLPCISCNERIFNVGDYKIKISVNNDAGLQKGGKYEFAVSGSDWMGRESFAQTHPNWLVEIPNENQTKSFKYSRIKCTIPSTGWPLWMKKLHIRFSKNLAYSDFITWVVDRFEFIDGTGLVNNVSPTMIKIYYESLN